MMEWCNCEKLLFKYFFPEDLKEAWEEFYNKECKDNKEWYKNSEPHV